MGQRAPSCLQYLPLCIPRLLVAVTFSTMLNIHEHTPTVGNRLYGTDVGNCMDSRRLSKTTLFAKRTNPEATHH